MEQSVVGTERHSWIAQCYVKHILIKTICMPAFGMLYSRSKTLVKTLCIMYFILCVGCFFQKFENIYNGAFFFIYFFG